MSKESEEKARLDALKAKGKVIYLKEKVTVLSTEKDHYHKTGSEVTLHPNLAEKGIKEGVYTPVKKAKD